MTRVQTLSGSSETRRQAERARGAFLRLSRSPDRSRILGELARQLSAGANSLLEANARDVTAASGLADSPFKRLVLDHEKIGAVVEGIEQLAAMADPVGTLLEQSQLDENLTLRKVRTPLGVVAAVFESRPDVVPQIAGLCLRTGNAVLLKGGKEAIHTNREFVRIIREVLYPFGVVDAVQLISSRDEVSELLEMDDLISLVVPRGSNAMVRSIQERTRIPVLGHADGICHIYVDAAADPAKASAICLDAKVQYPAACNSVETILLHRDFPDVQGLLQRLAGSGVELRVCDRTQARITNTSVRPAAPEDFGKEFSDKVVAVKTVDSIDDAIAHIHRYGSSHTDSIVTESDTAARRFLDEVDSAGVYWNASTRFADGFRYGFGAEVGISTNRTHARGPVGIDGLLIYKYELLGNGHTVAMYSGPDARRFLHERPKP